MQTSQRLGRARREGVRRGVLTVIRRSTAAANWILVLLGVPPPFRADRGQWRQRAPRRNEETSLFAMRRSSLLIKARVQALRRGCITCDAELAGRLAIQPMAVVRVVPAAAANLVIEKALPVVLCDLGHTRGWKTPKHR